MNLMNAPNILIKGGVLAEVSPITFVYIFLLPLCHSCLTKSLQRTMDPQNRKTASTYINNLLLSRGLLRNGAPIDFATPENAEGGLDATMGQVMNLVHDMILRRDVRHSLLKQKSYATHALTTYRSVIPTHWRASLKTCNGFGPPQRSRHRIFHA